MSITEQVARMFSEETMQELPEQLRLTDNNQALGGTGFIQQMRMCVDLGVTYDWMQKVIEWERGQRKR